MSYHPVQIDVVTTPAPFECTSCPERRFFTQRQVLFRHIREKHQARFECSCPGCDHKWTQSRTSEYRKHLKNKHGLEDDEIDMLLAQPPVVENDIPSHLSHPPVNVHHASTPLIPYVSHGSRLEDGEPEHTTTEHGGCGLEQLAATHAPRILSEEDFALLVRHHNIYGGFRFPSGHAGTGTTANVPPDLGISHIPALPAQQPGMQGPWFSSGFPAPQGSHPALPLPTQQEPLAPSEEMWDDTYLTVLGTQQYDEAACLYYSWSALGYGDGQEGDF